jgi:hypothetical protein
MANGRFSINTGSPSLSRLDSALASQSRRSFLDDIISSINDSSAQASRRTGNIKSIANIGRLLGGLTGSFAPLINLGIGLGESFFTDKELKNLKKDVKKQSDKGFLSSQLPQYLEDIEKGRRDTLLGNLLGTVATTGLSAYMQGRFPGDASIKADSLTQPTGFASMSSEELANQFIPGETGRLANLTTGRSFKGTAPPIKPNVPFMDLINPMEGMGGFFDIAPPQVSQRFGTVSPTNPFFNFSGGY